VLAKFRKRRNITGLSSSNKSIHFLIDLDVVLFKLGLEAMFVDAAIEVVFDCVSYFVLVCIDGRVIYYHSLLRGTPVVKAI